MNRKGIRIVWLVFLFAYSLYMTCVQKTGFGGRYFIGMFAIWACNVVGFMEGTYAERERRWKEMKG